MFLYTVVFYPVQELEKSLEDARCDVQLAQHDKTITVGQYEFRIEDFTVEIEVRKYESIYEQS